MSDPSIENTVPPRLELPDVLGWLADELGMVAASATDLQSVIATLSSEADDLETLSKLQDLDRLTQKADVLSDFVQILSRSVAEQPVEAVDRLLETLKLGELSQGLLRCATGGAEEAPTDEEKGWVEFF